MRAHSRWLTTELERRGVPRREFMGFCATMAAALALPDAAAAQIAQRRRRRKSPCCSGSSSRTARATPNRSCAPAARRAAEVVLDILSVDYHETIMAAAGHQAEQNSRQRVKERAGNYIAVVEGSIPDGRRTAPTARSAAARPSTSRARSARTPPPRSRSAPAPPSAAFPAAAPNPTGALGVADAVPGVKNLINLSACPANVENLTALLVHYLTFKTWPPLDHLRRPLFAYGKSIHDNCERRAHYDAGQYVEAWGDEGHRAGLLPLQDGLQGPRRHSRTAPKCAGTAARTGRSAAAIRASAAPSRTSGIA